MSEEQPEALPVRLAKRLCDGISTGHDWPNTDDELLRIQSAAELRRLHAENEALRAQIGQAAVMRQKPLTDEQRRDLQKVRDSLDPEDWCGDERMVDVLDRVLVASCCVNFAAGTSCFADPKSNCPRLAVAHGIKGE